MSARASTFWVVVLLSAVVILHGWHFYDWPPNRDVTTYAYMARELINGEELYVDVWDFKPPGIFAVYMIAQGLISSEPLQILLLDLVPTIVVLIALIMAAGAVGFGLIAGLTSGLFWVALSGDIFLQTHEPNTEIFINACLTLAFLLFLQLGRSLDVLAPLTIGVLFAIACLFKTVALAPAAVLGLMHVTMPPAGCRRSTAAGQVAVMAASGTACLLAVVAYFAATGRLQAFREVIVDAGASYAGDVVRNALDGLTLAPIVGDHVFLRTAVALLPWLSVAVLAWVDRERRRSWSLLGAYAFSALLAVGLPGKFYAHYFQLLVPPLCLGLGWLAGLSEARFARIPAASTLAILGLALVGLMAYEARTYRQPVETLLQGTYQELYLETQELGRRLGEDLRDDEVLYQWGEESGLYWYSDKRPTAPALRWPLVSGPQAERLTAQTLEALRAQPPDLIVAAKRIIDPSEDHPVFEWIRANYVPVQPHEPGERKFFTFFVPLDAPAGLVRRVAGRDAGAAAEPSS